MALKIFNRIILVLLAVITGGVAYLHFAARGSMDQEYRHTQATSALPLFSASSTDGLVRIPANGFEFRARIAGFGPGSESAQKPAVVLLHGFPVTSAMWNPLIGPLRDAGYRVLALDQRGYSPGARPDEVGDYTTVLLSRDVRAVATAVGIRKFHLVGHDWGAVVGWTTVLRQPQRVVSWTALSIAHPAAFIAALENDPDQKNRSGYFRLFVTPWLPETLFSLNNLERLRNMAWSNASTEQKDEYLAVFSEPGALTAALNWYRAMLISRNMPEQRSLQVKTPTLFIWGNRDVAVGRFAVEEQVQYMEGPFQEIELNAGHWLLQDQGETVTADILRHLEKFRDQ
jgi:pimeloyl-ACP methyl ester carboxylesterase